ncbi:hypothetical protein [Paraburkholderia diazotrophica]|uniref:hypothetical protein n=1 Tax=Paraburkholderia diazotrophica TaxID=667676 RepID=UPI003175BFD8
MARSIRANAKIDEQKMTSIVRELHRWRDGEFGNKLTWGRIEDCSGYTRQALCRHAPIVQAYQAAKRALAAPEPRSRSRSRSDEILYLDQTVQTLREQLRRYEGLERAWIERWQRIAYHCSRRGLSIEEFDSPIDEQHRR